MASWQKFGIKPELVERIKFKMKNPVTRDKIKRLIEGLNKYDLQDRLKVARLVEAAAKILNEPLTHVQEEQIVNFILSQKIDPQNTLHLIKLWSMFR